MSFEALKKAVTTPPGRLDEAELIMLDALQAADGERFLNEIVLKVANPLLLQTMWGTITAIVPIAKLEQAMIAALNGDDVMQAANALALPGFVFGMVDGYSPSANGARAMNAAAKRWANHPRLGQWATGFLLPEPTIDYAAEVAAEYERLGGGARDHTQKLGPPVKKGNTSSRPLAPLIDGKQFAHHMAEIGALEAAVAFLPKLAKMPEPMRILTLESLWGATCLEDFRFVEEQSALMLG